MLCFQETIKQDFSPSELLKLTGGFSFHWHMVPARGHSGGLLMGVREEDFDCLARDQGRFFCSMVILQKSTGRIWELINVYGPAQHEFSSDFLLELSEKLLSCDFPVMIGGDFNLIRFSSEKSSGNGNVVLMNLFNSHRTVRVSADATLRHPHQGAPMVAVAVAASQQGRATLARIRRTRSPTTPVPI
jgi:hypothetical protein